MSQAIELARNLIARRSVTPADEGCQSDGGAFGRRSASWSSRCATATCENFWARRGSGGLRCSALPGHTDVVPTGPLEEWRSDPFAPTVRDGLLYGRGAADMKSGLAAMMTATEEFVAAHAASLAAAIAFLITSDEEGPSVDGTKRVVRDTAPSAASASTGASSASPRARAAIGDTIKIGRRGSLSRPADRARRAGPRRLPAAGGKSGAHASLRPGRAHQPRLGPGDRALPARRASRSRTSTPAPGRPTSFPGELKARFNLRYSPVQTLEGLKRAVEEILTPPRRANTRSSGMCRASRSIPRPGRCRARCARRCGGDRPQAGSSRPAAAPRTAASSRPLGAQVVELGVVNASIHKVNECVRIEDIERCARCTRTYAAQPARLIGRADGRSRNGRRRQGQQGRAAINTQAGIARPRKRQ